MILMVIHILSLLLSTLRTKMIRFLSMLRGLKVQPHINLELFGSISIDCQKTMENGSTRVHSEVSTKNTHIQLQFKIKTIIKEKYKDNMISIFLSRAMS